MNRERSSRASGSATPRRGPGATRRTGSAGSTSRCTSRSGSTRCAASPSRSTTRSTTSSSAGWAARRSRPRCCGAASTSTGSTSSTRRIRGDPRARGEARPRADALRLVLEVGHDARDALPHRLLLGADRQARRAVRRVTDPGLRARAARARARLPRGLRRRAVDRRPLLGALAVRDRAGGADGRRRGAPARARAGDARGVPLRRGQSRLRARQPVRRGLAGGPRQDLHRRRAAATSGSGPSS